MPASPSPCPLSGTAARLRAAGCVFAEEEARLLISAARTPAELAAMTGRRAAGVPLEHVLGWAEFCGLRIAVDPGVFVPRRRTEFLVRQAASLGCRAAAHARQPAAPAGPAAGRAGHAAATSRATCPGGQAPAIPSQAGVPGGQVPGRPGIVVDLCCGSGAVGAALAAALGPVELHAADIDPAAVACARRNVADAGGQVHEGDLYEPLPAVLAGRVGILAANVPYVPAAEVGLLPPEARDHEARVALDGGADGLDVLRRVAAAAPLWLAPGGSLLAETSERQASRAAGILARAGLIAQVARCGELNATVVIGTKPSGPGDSAY
ncbi:MAG TPA: putative protein N(5)-glutamine methyltransferase [Streptosporangiaceae bacterium]|nr:putative protein N(5)-glutamine methyltransferase [Streptosporangiaceae bacterium]